MFRHNSLENKFVKTYRIAEWEKGAPVTTLMMSLRREENQGLGKMKDRTWVGWQTRCEYLQTEQPKLLGYVPGIYEMQVCSLL